MLDSRCGEALAGAALVVERLLQQPRFVASVQPSGAGPSAAVGGQDVVFDALRRADDGGVAGVFCRRSMHAIVGFLNDPVEARAELGRCRSPSA
jgi:hypothetical protein